MAGTFQHHRLIATLILLVMVVCGFWWRSAERSVVPVARQMNEARRAAASGDVQSADQLCETILKQNPNHYPALLMRGDLAMRRHQFEAALQYFRRIPESDSTDSVAAQMGTAEVLRAMGKLSEAESGFRRLLHHQPRHLAAHERLAFILDMEGRRWESIPHLMEQLRQDQISWSCLIRLGTRHSAIPFPEELNRVRSLGHETATLALADAVRAMANQSQDQEALLRKALELGPDSVEAQVRWGLYLADHRLHEVPAWHAHLPREAFQHPDVHVVTGLWCRSVGQNDAALRELATAAQLDPNQRVAHYQFAQISAMNEYRRHSAVQAAGIPAANRAEDLQKLAATLTQLTLNEQDITAMKTVADLMQKLGRYWEAYGWCGLILNTDPTQHSVRENMIRLSQMLSPDLPRNDPKRCPLAGLRLTDFPAPVWPDPASPSTVPPVNSGVSEQIVFVDRAEEAQLRFRYFHGRDHVSPGTRMYEFAGGGTGIIDYDNDGRPDVLLTQGCRWPASESSSEFKDQLFRNAGYGRFQNVTAQSNTGDGWFSQGISVGDFDDDGWPDFYVANIGGNTLHHNNGDGTWSEVTGVAEISGDQWTTSCVMADLNGDALPDLYDVNYLKGDRLFERLCLIEGQERACVPGVFSPEQDRIFLNQGDGSFAESDGGPAAPLASARPGMGAVALDLDGSGRLSLFVANDVMANGLLINHTTDPALLNLRDNALLSGTAFDRDGKAQACMGIAADDVDGNGLTDLFVTNYYAEANSLYLQIAPQQFVESSRSAELYDPSLKMLGFGAQFLDADLDGSTDLVVTNGHLDDFSYLQIPYRMPPQFFRNRGNGTFDDVSSTAGHYFQRSLLGRSLAVLDWNTDGRPDFIVSPVDANAALLTNESRNTGHWLKVTLCGRQSSRDAFGTTVILEFDSKQQARQLIAGSGYQANNERTLLFGLGQATEVSVLTVQWPSGSRQTFQGLPTNRHIIILEGRDQTFEVPSPG
ncbi:MAG: VCBS repeat-containing protein [Planctomycetaceae bacterium]|nr:VCBS repeat-containing protein [Planctomycetaceae bacterium]